MLAVAVEGARRVLAVVVEGVHWVPVGGVEVLLSVPGVVVFPPWQLRW